MRKLPYVERMEKPTSLTFDGLDVSLNILDERSSGPMDLAWIRTQFNIPDQYDAPKAVHDWLTFNCHGEWSSYYYTAPKFKSGEGIMVVRFKDRNDALMFKLRDGHKAWETT